MAQVLVFDIREGFKLPYAKCGDVNLYYESHGEGDPLLLIEGLGYATWMWFKQIPELAEHFRVIVFDNRGVGYSDKPDYPYTIQMMANDAAALLKFLGLEESHILGVSMGGMIAQRFARDYPGLVDKLILCCTSHGGPNSIPAPPETIKAMTEIEGLSAEQALCQAMAVAFSKQYLESNREEFDKIIRWRLNNPTPQYSWQHQFNAVLNFNSEDWVNYIDKPTLIVTGSDDRVIPPQNSEMLHQKIDGSELIKLENGGHLFFMEKPGEFNKQVIDFLKG